MPLNSESLSTQSRREFCLALKAARERNGVTLASIADETKIPASLFAGLERGDLRCWPKGLFRRSFFRDYARMIGLPVAEACAQFVRWFPDDEGAQPTTAAAVVHEASQAHDVRLELDAAWRGPRTSLVSRLLAALLDALVVVLMASAVVWVAGVDRSATTAGVALAYFSLATALLGQSPARWAMSSHWSIFEAMTPAAIPALWRSGAEAISQLFGSAGGSPDTVEAPEMPPTPLRVRIKLSP